MTEVPFAEVGSHEWIDPALQRVTNIRIFHVDRSGRTDRDLVVPDELCRFETMTPSEHAAIRWTLAPSSFIDLMLHF
jgi:hypothetical protein